MSLPAGAAAPLTAISNRMMPHRATIERPSTTTGPGGVVAPTYTTVASGVPCRRAIAGHSAGERVIADQVQPIITDAVVFQPGTDVRAQDRITVTGTDVAGHDFTLVLEAAVVLGPLVTEAMRKVLCSEIASPTAPTGGG